MQYLGAVQKEIIRRLQKKIYWNCNSDWLLSSLPYMRTALNSLVAKGLCYKIQENNILTYYLTAKGRSLKLVKRRKPSKYRDLAKSLQCSISTIAYHSKKGDLNTYIKKKHWANAHNVTVNSVFQLDDKLWTSKLLAKHLNSNVPDVLRLLRKYKHGHITLSELMTPRTVSKEPVDLPLDEKPRLKVSDIRIGTWELENG